MSRLVLIFAILDDLLLFAVPAVLAIVLFLMGVVPWWLALAVAAPFVAVAVFVGVKVLREKPPEFAYVGGRGVAVEDLKPEGLVKVRGEYWRAVCDNCNASAGSCVEVVEVRDGRAYVRPC
ncbi:MAG: NfeD family protein [Pyrobaculum sp.]